MATGSASQVNFNGNSINGTGNSYAISINEDSDADSILDADDAVLVDWDGAGGNDPVAVDYTYLGTTEIDGVTYALLQIDGDGGDGSFDGTILAVPEDGSTILPNSRNIGRVDQINTSGSIDEDLCFARGVMIATPDGECAVEDLKAGDLVCTWDGREVELLWTGSNKHHPFTLRRNPQIVPIEIAAGALGPNTPDRTLVVSPDHALHIHDPLAELTHDSADVIVEAEALLTRPGVRRTIPEHGVEYFVLLCPRHELLLANGAAAESLYPTRRALSMMTEAQLDEIEAALPGFRADPSAAIGAEVAPRLGQSEYAALRGAAAA